MSVTPMFVGCAGWNLRKETADDFPTAGTHLQRYAARLNAVEINSSFYRPHRRQTYERWSSSTPRDFRFAVKMPKHITHQLCLIGADAQIEAFLDQTSGLGEKLGAILVQLPPSLAFELPIAEHFFRDLRARTEVPIVCEPRHRSWFEAEPDSTLMRLSVSRVAADPSIVPEAAKPGGSTGICYFRWHGSPHVYYSSYDGNALCKLAQQIEACSKTASIVWCIFDNTAVGAAQTNALALRGMIG